MVSGLMVLGEQHLNAVLRARLAEDQLSDLQHWLRLYFEDHDKGAEEFLREVVAMYVEDLKAKAA